MRIVQTLRDFLFSKQAGDAVDDLGHDIGDVEAREPEEEPNVLAHLGQHGDGAIGVDRPQSTFTELWTILQLECSHS